MKKLMCAGIALVFVFLHGAAQAADNATYFIAQIEITDQKGDFESYGANVGPLLQQAGAEVLVATPDRQQLEGDWTVVIKFPSKEKALGWYQSDAFQAIRPLRLRSASENKLILAPSFDPAQVEPAT